MLVVDKKYNHILVDMSPNGFGINYNITNYVRPTKYGIFVGINPFGSFLSGIGNCRPSSGAVTWEQNCYIIRDNETILLSSKVENMSVVQPYSRIKVIPHDNEMPNLYHTDGCLSVLTYMLAKKKFDRNESGDFVFYNRIYDEVEVASGRNLLNYLTDCSMYNGKELWTEFDLKELRAQCNGGGELLNIKELSMQIMRIANSYNNTLFQASVEARESSYCTFFDEE